MLPPPLRAPDAHIFAQRGSHLLPRQAYVNTGSSSVKHPRTHASTHILCAISVKTYMYVCMQCTLPSSKTCGLPSFIYGPRRRNWPQRPLSTDIHEFHKHVVALAFFLPFVFLLLHRLMMYRHADSGLTATESARFVGQRVTLVQSCPPGATLPLLFQEPRISKLTVESSDRKVGNPATHKM